MKKITEQDARAVIPSTLERSKAIGEFFIPTGGYANLVDEYDYIEEEWFASGTDDTGQEYKTQVVVRRPRDPALFSGTVIIEPLHAASAAPIWIYTARFIMRSGHGWACVASQKSPLDSAVKPSNKERYASLHIETAEPAPDPQQTPPSTPTDFASRMAAMARTNQASNAILAQAGAALRAPSGPFGKVNHILLVGHSQTGGVVTSFTLNAHASHRLAGGAPIYDGLFPSGAARNAFGPRDVPLVQLVSEADVDDGERSSGRAYRRDDSDEANDRYRLYELAGAPHMGTRYPPYNDPASWAERGIQLGAKMSSYPHHEMFNVCLSHLVNWVTDGVAPPRGARIKTEPDGRFFAKDEHGNSLGGVRCAQMDVPHITYHPDPVNDRGEKVQSVVGNETPFDAAKLKELYGTPADYAQQFNQRLDELIDEGWFLAEDAEGMRAEAQSLSF